MLTLPAIDPVAYHRDILPTLATGPQGAAAAAAVAAEPPFAVRVGDHAWTYRASGDRIAIADGVTADARVVLELSDAAWSDFAQLVRTIPALMIAGEVAVIGGGPSLDRWERALRTLYQGVPIANPDAVAIVDAEGQPVDLTRSFTLDDADAELGDFLGRAGVMRVREVFSADEIAALNGEVDRLAAAARPGDDRSWWSQRDDGSDVLNRLVYASENSPLIAELANNARLRRLVNLVGGDLQPTTDRMEGIGVVIKPPGRLRGLANIPWHTDCGLGGHLIQCPSVAIGVQLTDATPETGCFEAIAGTHGASCPVPTPDDLTRWPHLLVPTKAGDVTVHIADLMHASPRPTAEGGRRTMYVSYYPPTLFEHVGPGEAYNDAIRRRTATDVADALAGR
jgi:ectoine hydroxylase-related dioxygenase (phytanoyl-CoA dioxygenase family)